MKQLRQAVATWLVATMVCCGVAWAGNGVDPATIRYKEWGVQPPVTMTLIGARNVVRKALFLDDTFSFRWEGSAAMTELGMDLLARNGIQPGERVPRVVRELYLGPPDGVPLPDQVADSYRRLSMERLRDVPPGAVRVLLARTTAGGAFGEAISVSFDASLSDDYLRRIHFEQGVLRVLGYRED